MTQRMPSPQSEEQPAQKKGSRKKLQKREQRILERLQEAQAAQARALQRFQRAEARLQKRTQRLQRVEGRLVLIRQQLSGESQEAPPPVTQDTEPGAAKEEEKATEQAEMEQQPAATGPDTPESVPSQVLVDEGPAPSDGETAREPSTGDAFVEEILLVDAAEHVGLPPAYTGDTQEQPAEEAEAATPQAFSSKSSYRVQEARAAAEAAEENARLAADRAADVTARIEQMGSGRHLMQELLETQAEADRASVIAQEAERAAEQVEQQERLSSSLEMATEASVSPEAPQTEANGEEELFPSLEVIGLAAPDIAIASPDEITVIEEQEEIAQPAQDSPLTPAVENTEIEEEEEMVEALAAKSIAEIAAERAASAEAIAEASSVQTREAHRRVQEVEAVLGQVRLAIRSGSLSGAEAELALQNAENELTRASAFLADAEATEEQALNNAMNAEAEAEVAEGMAYAASERELEDVQEAPLPDLSTTENGPAEEDDDELDATQKIRVVHPPESL